MQYNNFFLNFRTTYKIVGNNYYIFIPLKIKLVDRTVLAHDQIRLLLYQKVYTVWLGLSVHMSLVVRKLVFGVSDQVRHKPGCAVTGDG